MVTVDNLGAEDDELELLCQDRPEDKASEFFPPNAWYGAAEAIRSFCGWPTSRPLPMVVPHGLDFTVDALWRSEVDTLLPAIYSFHDYRDELYRTASDKLVIPGCSPWLYLMEIIKIEFEPKRSVLIMPAHSTANVRTELDHDRLIDMIAERFPHDPLKCCMYWRDVQHGMHLPYLMRGIPVVSAGHIFDRRFLRRLARILGGAKHMVTNEYGSNVGYAASVGVPVTVLPQVEITWIGTPELVAHDCEVGQYSTEFLEVEPLFRSNEPDVTLQQAAMRRLMGQHRMLGQVALYELLDSLWRGARLGPRWVLRRLPFSRSLRGWSHRWLRGKPATGG